MVIDIILFLVLIYQMRPGFRCCKWWIWYPSYLYIFSTTSIELPNSNTNQYVQSLQYSANISDGNTFFVPITIIILMLMSRERTSFLYPFSLGSSSHHNSITTKLMPRYVMYLLPRYGRSFSSRKKKQFAHLCGVEGRWAVVAGQLNLVIFFGWLGGGEQILGWYAPRWIGAFRRLEQ